MQENPRQSCLAGFLAVDSGLQVLDSEFFVSGTWNPDSNVQWDTGLLELYSEFQSLGFWIVQQKFSGFQNLHSLT